MRSLQIPISVGKIADAPQRVIEGRMRKGDAGVYMEDEYLQFVTDNTDQFAKVLEQFQNEDNYPILIRNNNFITSIYISHNRR